MKALLRIFLPGIFAIAISACYTPADYKRNNTATAAWLSENAGTSRLNLNGAWYVDGWGDAFLEQEGNKITGHIGRFPVGGVVKGTTLFLAITDEGWTSWTAILAYAGPGHMKGYYSEQVPYTEDDREDIELKRTDR